MKVCTRCSQEKSLDDFYLQKRRGGKYAPMPHCKECHCAQTNGRLRELSAEDRAAHNERARARALMRKYGITIDHYNTLLEAQDGVCNICGREEISKDHRGKVRLLAVDHDHNTGAVRGLCCLNCNTKLGWLEANLSGALTHLGVEVTR